MVRWPADTIRSPLAVTVLLVALLGSVGMLLSWRSRTEPEGAPPGARVTLDALDAGEEAAGPGAPRDEEGLGGGDGTWDRWLAPDGRERDLRAARRQRPVRIVDVGPVNRVVGRDVRLTRSEARIPVETLAVVHRGGDYVCEVWIHRDDSDGLHAWVVDATRKATPQAGDGAFMEILRAP